MNTAAPAIPTATIHPLWLRITHWINALSVVIMILSGWRIYNASPIFPFSFPREWTLGGWLGGALQWHFAAMWLLALNGLAYLALNLLTGRARRKFFPLRPKEVARDMLLALKGRLQHASLADYNAVQKLAYLSVIADLALIVLSGLAIWKSVQLPFLREVMGGYDNARVVHFFAMSFLVLFIAVHVAMVAMVPRTLLAMLRGR
ncbi:cytochrome b/b6 domain-containing protein [Herbaspirillum sp. RV1423]|uniref:cytochrome b/b6 domain-containing protein n=1 Tax=Herbaspirillum sp. RV1423 TaxID=1443993 RepID=UPI0004B4241C|nr:cytochrome b/b6 domain-containing protein [Herbaspirillum sp. RV1423]